jgi:hypothetical protein
MKDFDKKYRMGIELFKKEEFKKSFSVFEALALDERNSHEDRAYAYSMMGMLVECYDPCLAPGEDESGLEFYQAALALDPDNLHALRGIVSSFDYRVPYIRHQDTGAFLSAYNKLMANPTELLEGEAEMLQNQYNLMECMLKERAKDQGDIVGEVPA